MAESIEFSLLQRLSLEGLLGQQRGNVADLITLFDITNKIKVKDRGSYVRELPDGRVLVDNEAISKAEVMPVELEKAERRKLLDIIKSHDGFGPSDLAWILPLKKQLEALD
jgi:hypothetical protein